MAYQKYKDIPNRREPLGGRDHIQHIETGLAAAYEEGLGGIKPEDGVFGVGVRRIIASTDPNHPLEDGDLLVLIDAETFFTDFSQETTGQMPSGWSQPWATTGTWTVENATGATGGKVLRVAATGVGRNALLWDVAGSGTDAEIVYRWRTTSISGSQPRGAVRGDGAPSQESAVIAGPAPSTQTSGIVLTYENGVRWATSNIEGAAPTRAVNTWIRSRMRVSGDTVRYREWADGSTEPSTWGIDMPISGPLTPGKVGLFMETANTCEIDWIGAAFDGVPAPTGG